MSASTTECSQCGQLFLKGKGKEHNDSCIGKPLCGGGAVSSTVVPPKKCRDCGEPLTGPYWDHKPKCSSKIAKAAGPEKSPALSGGGGGNNSKGPKGSQNSSAAAPVGGGGGQADPVTPPLVGGGGGKKLKAPKGSDDSSAAASSGGGGNKGPAKAVAVEDLTLIPKKMAQNIPGFIFVNISGIAIKVSGVCAHMVQGPGFCCTVDGCSGKLLKGGYCYTTATGILFAVVEPKTVDNNRAYWRKPTEAEISLLKMPVAATAPADV